MYAHAVLPNPTATRPSKKPATIQPPHAATATLLDEAAVTPRNPGEANQMSQPPKQEVQPNPTATTPAKKAVTVQLPQATTAMLPEKAAVTSETPHEIKQFSRQPNLAATRGLGG